jgi:excisionase family DNA binding protein
MRDGVNQPGELERLLSVREICAALGCSDRALRRWIIAGRFPQADVVLGTRQLRWRASTVIAFIGGDRTYASPRLATGT